MTTEKLTAAGRTLIVTARARSRVDLLFIREPESSADRSSPWGVLVSRTATEMADL